MQGEFIPGRRLLQQRLVGNSGQDAQRQRPDQDAPDVLPAGTQLVKGPQETRPGVHRGGTRR